MVYDGRDYLAEIVAIFGFISLTLIIFFCFFYSTLGIFLVLGLFGYVMFFIFRDRKMKRDELNNLLHTKKTWIKRNSRHIQLGKERP